MGGLDARPGEHIGMVGFFPPLVKRVTARGARLTVPERRADLAGPREGFDITLDAAELAGCTQLPCTSTARYPNALDQFVKHELKCRCYLRYCDDFVLVAESAAQLANWQARIARFLAERLLL
jgi:hypothetical protein